MLEFIFPACVLLKADGQILRRRIPRKLSQLFPFRPDRGFLLKLAPPSCATTASKRDGFRASAESLRDSTHVRTGRKETSFPSARQSSCAKLVWETGRVIQSSALDAKGGLLTLVERKTKLTKIAKLPRATAAQPRQ
jgi:hypothetical protein